MGELALDGSVAAVAGVLSAAKSRRVARARAIQAERYGALGLANVRTNAEASGPVLEEVGRPDASGLALLRDAADAMRLSARGYHRVLKVARTLADQFRRAA